jgi:phosphoserine aminotransferase
MKIAHNFNAGPCVLPREAVENTIEALKDYKGTGMSVIEVSHRSKEWEATMEECRSLWKEILNIPTVIKFSSWEVVQVCNFFMLQ